MLRNVLLVCLAALMFACDKDDEQPTTKEEPRLILSFDPLVNGTEIQLNERFTNPQGYRVEATQIQFYLAHIKLHSGSSTIDLEEIAIISIEGNKRTLEFDIPEGDYTALSFDLGVPVELNGTQNPDFTTSLYDPDHPLSVNNGMYWGWAAGYRFFSFDGRCDTSGSMADFEALPFTFHTGRDTLYREVDEFAKSFSAKNGDVVHFQFGVELNTIFDGPAGTVDLSSDRSFHGSPDQMKLGTTLAGNSAASFVLMN